MSFRSSLSFRKSCAIICSTGRMRFGDRLLPVTCLRDWQPTIDSTYLRLRGVRFSSSMGASAGSGKSFSRSTSSLSEAWLLSPRLVLHFLRCSSRSLSRDSWELSSERMSLSIFSVFSSLEKTRLWTSRRLFSLSQMMSLLIRCLAALHSSRFSSTLSTRSALPLPWSNDFITEGLSSRAFILFLKQVSRGSRLELKSSTARMQRSRRRRMVSWGGGSQSSSSMSAARSSQAQSSFCRMCLLVSRVQLLGLQAHQKYQQLALNADNLREDPAAAALLRRQLVPRPERDPHPPAEDHDQLTGVRLLRGHPGTGGPEPVLRRVRPGPVPGLPAHLPPVLRLRGQAQDLPHRGAALHLDLAAVPVADGRVRDAAGQPAGGQVRGQRAVQDGQVPVHRRGLGGGGVQHRGAAALHQLRHGPQQGHHRAHHGGLLRGGRPRLLRHLPGAVLQEGGVHLHLLLRPVLLRQGAARALQDLAGLRAGQLRAGRRGHHEAGRGERPGGLQGLPRRQRDHGPRALRPQAHDEGPRAHRLLRRVHPLRPQPQGQGAGRAQRRLRYRRHPRQPQSLISLAQITCSPRRLVLFMAEAELARLKALHPHLLVPLDEYSVLQFIDRGSFGGVYLAAHKHSRRKVAIKVLSKARALINKHVDRVWAEIACMVDCPGPFICELVGVGEVNYYVYLVQEYVDSHPIFMNPEVGNSLEVLLNFPRRRRKLPHSEALFYAAELFLALETLQLNGYAHRDLKPENVLIDESGHLKLIDFGCAKKIEGYTYTTCGSPQYNAPEMIRGMGYRKSTDWWSYGVIVFEMVEGKELFSRELQPMSLFKSILQHTPKLIPFSSATNPMRLFIRGLVQSDLSLRLGTTYEGPSVLTGHSVFKELDFDKLRARTQQSVFERRADSVSKKWVKENARRPAQVQLGRSIDMFAGEDLHRSAFEREAEKEVPVYSLFR